jgi:hypothetical protein
VDVLRRRKYLYWVWNSCRGHSSLFWGIHCETSYYSRLGSQRCKVSQFFLLQPCKIAPKQGTCVEKSLCRTWVIIHQSDREYVLAFRFLQYWGRIGSENNMTSCHRPICRKEGVLLDYSTDGGMFHGWKPLLEADSHFHPTPLETSLQSFADSANCEHYKKLYCFHYMFYRCDFCVKGEVTLKN